MSMSGVLLRPQLRGSLMNTSGVNSIKDDMQFYREMQKTIAGNIARSSTPDAKPYTLERLDDSFPTKQIGLAAPSSGASMTAVSSPKNPLSQKVIDDDSMAERVPGHSRISIEAESLKMSDTVDAHHRATQRYAATKRAFKTVLGGN